MGVGPLHGPRIAEPASIAVDVRWFEPLLDSRLERSVVQGLHRHYWQSVCRPGAPAEQAFVEALSRYMSAKLEGLAWQHYTRSASGGGFLTVDLFGRLVPVPIRSVRLSDEPGRFPDVQEPALRRQLLALGTLERYVGQSAFETAVEQLAGEPAPRVCAFDGFVRHVEATSGLRLDWFEREFATGRAFDYLVRRVEIAPQPGGRWLTTVVVGRKGDAVFSGTSRGRLGDFQAGRAVGVTVTFDDGARAEERWDGVDRERAFEYDSAAPPATVSIDPDDVIQFDTDVTNNSWTRSPAASRAAAKWTTRWLIWLQDALLTFASFV